MFRVGSPCYLGLNSGRSVSINVNRTRKNFSRSPGAHIFPSFPEGKQGFQCQFLFSRLSLRYTAGNLTSEHASTCKNFASTSKQALILNFCEQFEQRPNFASTFKLNGTIRYPSVLCETISFPAEPGNGWVGSGNEFVCGTDWKKIRCILAPVGLSLVCITLSDLKKTTGVS